MAIKGLVDLSTGAAVADADTRYLAATGTPALPSGATATTQAAGDNSTKLATTAYSDRLTLDINRYGFTDPSAVVPSFDGVDSFTLKGVTWSYYRTGVKYTISGNKSVTVATPMVNGTKYYIYIDSANGALISGTSSWTLEDTKVPVATLYWDNTMSPAWILARETHSCLIDRRYHWEHHFTEGTLYMSGGLPSGYVVASETDSAKTFGLTAAVIADEDQKTTASAFADPSGAVGAYYIFYRAPTTLAWSWILSDMPFKYGGSAGAYTYIEYDSATGTLPSQNNRFVNTYLMVTQTVVSDEATYGVSTSPFRFIMVEGRGSFSSTALAYAESFASFTMTGFPFIEAVAIYQFTWDTTGRGASVKGRCLLNRAPVRVSTNVIQSAGVAVGSHNTLTGIQGGQSGEYFHLTAAQNDALSGTALSSNLNLATSYAYQINGVNMLHLGAGPIGGNLFVGNGGANLDPTPGYPEALENTAVGVDAGLSLTTGSQNVAVGGRALNNNTIGSQNVAVGGRALNNNTTGNNNVAIGTRALYSSVGGFGNVAVGDGALFYLANSVGTGRNVAVGFNAGWALTTGYGNIYIGDAVEVGSESAINEIVIGQGAGGRGNNTVVIGNPLVTSISGQVGFTALSDARLKNSIEDNPIGLDFILALRPRRFKMNSHGPEAKILDGFVAQEVMQAMADLGVDFSGLNAPLIARDFYGITYDKFVVPLVNAVKELKVELDALKTR